MSTIDTNVELGTSQEVGAEKISAYLWLAFTVCFFGNIFAGLVTTLMSAVLPDVVKSLVDIYLPTGATEADALATLSGTISAIYIAGWTVGGFTWGYISDKIGRTRAIALSVGTLGLFTLLITFAPSWIYVVAFRFLSGFGTGGILVLTPTLLSEIWPAKTRSIALGVDSCGFVVGIFASGILTNLASDWREAFFVGIPVIILALIAVAVLKESVNWKNARAAVANNRIITSPEDQANLVRGVIIFGSMLIALWGMFSWIPTWVQSLLTSDGKSERGITMMMLGAGGLLGGSLSGWISNALGVRKAMLLCFAGCLTMSLLLFGLNTTFSPVVYPELALLSMFFGISQGLLSIYIPQLFPYHIRGTYTGICFNTGRIFTTAAIFFVGLIVVALDGYRNALLAFSGIFVIGFIALYLMKDQQQQKKA